MYCFQRFLECIVILFKGGNPPILICILHHSKIVGIRHCKDYYFMMIQNLSEQLWHGDFWSAILNSGKDYKLLLVFSPTNAERLNNDF